MKKPQTISDFMTALSPEDRSQELLYQTCCDYYRYCESLEEKLKVLQKCPSCFIDLQ